MILRLKEGVQIPYTITRKGVSYTFAPDCEVPDDYGRALIQTNPNRYEVAQGDPDLTQYTFKDEFKNKTLADRAAVLSEEGKVKVLRFIDKVYDEEQLKAASPPMQAGGKSGKGGKKGDSKE